MALELKEMRTPSPRPPTSLQDREEALKAWNSYKNVDRLLDLMYQYYIGGGRQNIILDKLVQLGIVLFVVCFGVFLAYGIEWPFLWRPATAQSIPGCGKSPTGLDCPFL